MKYIGSLLKMKNFQQPVLGMQLGKKHTKDPTNKFIWHKYLPFSVSIFIWRAFRGKLQTNEKPHTFGKEAIDCYCCYRSGKDKIDHILPHGHFFKYIQEIHATLVGTDHSNTNLRSLLMHWRSYTIIMRCKSFCFKYYLILFPGICGKTGVF